MGNCLMSVVQLRQDNAVATLYNIVGFQTHLKWGEQKRILSMIPGLEMYQLCVMVLCIEIPICVHQKY